ncbi:hypothetical protein BD777DRAFT_121361 [Yarrowia lipolytica]|nr:hypothetical protein BD777DRAFT_121361 [Yarrowia lipolytica]
MVLIFLVLFYQVVALPEPQHRGTGEEDRECMKRHGTEGLPMWYANLRVRGSRKPKRF